MLAKTILLATPFLVPHPVRAQSCPAQGLIESIGAGTPGTAGTPVLDTVGVPLQDKVFWLELSEGLPGASGVVLGGSAQAAIGVPQFGATLYLSPPFFKQTFTLDGEGRSAPLFQLPSVPDLCGLEYLAQCVVFDASAVGGIAFSQAVRARFGGPASGSLFRWKSSPLVHDGPNSMATGHVDGDGLLDLVVANVFSGDISVLLGSGDGTFGAAKNFVVGFSPSSVALEDLDGDGVLDLVATHVLLNSLSVSMGLGHVSFAPPVAVATGGGPRAIVVEDLDADGVLDVVTVNAGDLSVLLGLGDGTFANPQAFPAGYSPWSVAVADLDGNGTLDLAVANRDTIDEVSILLGGGDGSFSSPQSFSAGPTFGLPTDIASGDLDGDGALDLAVVIKGLNGVSILQGLGDGTFSAPKLYSAGIDPRSVAIDDLDADGKLDLVVANFSAGEVSLLPGLGDGSLGAPLGFHAGDGSVSAVVEDLDGDGDPDLVVSNTQSDDVTVLLNQLLQ